MDPPGEPLPMDPVTAVRSALSILGRPAGILPAYFLGPAVPAVTRAVVFVGVGVVYLYLLATDRITRFREAIADLDAPPDPDSPAFEAWAESLIPALDIVVTPTTVAVVFVSVLAAIVVSAVATSIAMAAQLSASYGRLRAERGLPAAVRGARAYWVPVLGLRILEFVLWVLVFAVGAFAVGVGFLVFPPLGVLLGLLALPATLTALVVIRAVFAFAPVGVVVDDATAGDGLRGSVGFIRSEPAHALAYYGLAFGVIVALGTVSAGLAIFGAGALVAVVGFVVVTPLLDLTKTALYGGYRESVSPPAAAEGPTTGRLKRGLRRGVDEMLAFVARTPGLHVTALAVGVAGFAGGWFAIEPFADTASTSIADRLADHNPIAATVEFGANNWTVAVSTAFSGLALAVPTALALLFNGVVFGIYGRTEETQLELLAFVLPHGVFEIPAILIAGALGFHLGAVVWRSLRGRIDTVELADELETAFWISVGLAVLLTIAAVIEGFFSPYYYRPFL